jgi:hypothetical protein
MFDALCKYSLGVVLALGFGSCFLSFGSKWIKTGFFVCDGFGKTKNLFLFTYYGKNKCRLRWEEPLVRWEVGIGWAQKSQPPFSAVFLFFYYLWLMNTVDVIGLVSSIFGILSFFGIGISVFSLFKKNLFLRMHAFPYGLNEVLCFKKKCFQ